MSVSPGTRTPSSLQRAVVVRREEEGAITWRECPPNKFLSRFGPGFLRSDNDILPAQLARSDHTRVRAAADSQVLAGSPWTRSHRGLNTQRALAIAA